MPPPKDIFASIFGLLVILFGVVILPAALIAGGVWGIIHPDFIVKRYAHFRGIPAMVFSSASIFGGLAAWRFFWVVARGPGRISDDAVLRVLLICVAFALAGGVLLWAGSPI
ncbi:MAG: hypothetical protein IT434_02950 [Phycisphaerales bacterium]|jgi:hypothetical protein|nr:hypothetical protein [Phycisphaerales bacterium]